MPFNMTLNYIYDFQLWVCTNRHLNLYKVEQIDTHVLHVILHVIFCPTWCSTCIVSCSTHVFIYLKVEQLKCLFVLIESWRSKLKFEAKFRVQCMYYANIISCFFIFFIKFYKFEPKKLYYSITWYNYLVHFFSFFNGKMHKQPSI